MACDSCGRPMQHDEFCPPQLRRPTAVGSRVMFPVVDGSGGPPSLSRKIASKLQPEPFLFRLSWKQPAAAAAVRATADFPNREEVPRTVSGRRPHLLVSLLFTSGLSNMRRRGMLRRGIQRFQPEALCPHPPAETLNNLALYTA